MNTAKNRTTMIEARKKLGLKQKDLARIVGISRSQISNIENGFAVPSLVVAHRISLALDVKMEILFLDDLASV